MKGLGILEFLAWSLLVSFCVNSYRLYNFLMILIFNNGLSGFPSTPPWVLTIAWSQLFYHAVLVVAFGYSLYLFWNDEPLFKTLTISIFVGMILFWLGATIFIDMNTDVPEPIEYSARYLYKNILIGVIWIPYLLFSKRVKETFSGTITSPKISTTIVKHKKNTTPRK